MDQIPASTEAWLIYIDDFKTNYNIGITHGTYVCPNSREQFRRERTSKIIIYSGITNKRLVEILQNC